MNETHSINLSNVSLLYDLYYDKTNNLKERVLNGILKRGYVDEQVGKLWALKDLSLEIKQGDRLGVIGLNGAGKSTLLKVISGILKPTNGHVSVKGNIQPLIEIAAGFDPESTGRENIYLNGYMLGFTKEQIKIKEKEIIDFTDLGHFIDVPIKYYSSGMSVRLAFTIATTVDPEILIFDEMLSAGDAEFMAKARKRMDDLLAFAKILVLVSHDLGMIKALATRVIVLEQGKMIFDGKTEDALDFYLERVEGRIEAKRIKKQEELKKRSEEERKWQELKEKKERGYLILNKFTFANDEFKSKSIEPDTNISVQVDYSIRENFQEVFVNLSVTDKFGVSLIHLRNDYSKVSIKPKIGNYQININIPQHPLKSGNYKAKIRIVGVTKEGQQLIWDTDSIDFNVSGTKEEHTFLNNDWDVKSY